MRLRGLMCVLETALLVGLAGCQRVSLLCPISAPPEALQNNATMYAVCKMRPSSTLPDDLIKVYGQVLFKQEYPHGELKVILKVSGFPSEATPQPRAVHIHQYGDLSRGCDSTGGHYNPKGVDHPNHPGDFGNFEPQEGKIYSLVDSKATLFTEHSVIGRAVVIHEKRDDLGLGGNDGSRMHGNAGRRLGCCIIGLSSPNLWTTSYKVFNRQIRN